MRWELFREYKGEKLNVTLKNGTSVKGKVMRRSRLPRDSLVLETSPGMEKNIPFEDVSTFLKDMRGGFRWNPSVGPATFSFHIKPEKPWTDPNKVLSALEKKVNEIALVAKEEPVPSLVSFSLKSTTFRDWTIEIGEIQELREEREISLVSSSESKSISKRAPINGFARTVDVNAIDFLNSFNRFSEVSFQIANAVGKFSRGISVHQCFALLPKGSEISDAVEKVLSWALPGVNLQSIHAYAELKGGVVLVVGDKSLSACGPPERIRKLVKASIGD